MATRKPRKRRRTAANPVTATKGLRAVLTSAQAAERDRRLIESGLRPASHAAIF